MGSAKWIGGLLGWVSGGPIGALLGYFLGSAVEKFIDAARQLPGDFDELVNGRSDEVSQQGPDGTPGHPAEQADYPFC